MDQPQGRAPGSGSGARGQGGQRCPRPGRGARQGLFCSQLVAQREDWASCHLQRQLAELPGRLGSTPRMLSTTPEGVLPYDPGQHVPGQRDPVPSPLAAPGPGAVYVPETQAVWHSRTCCASPSHGAPPLAGAGLVGDLGRRGQIVGESDRQGAAQLGDAPRLHLPQVPGRCSPRPPSNATARGDPDSPPAGSCFPAAGRLSGHVEAPAAHRDPVLPAGIAAPVPGHGANERIRATRTGKTGGDRGVTAEFEIPPESRHTPEHSAP